MNPKIIKLKISKLLGKEVIITVYGMRNKKTKYIGPIYKVYPNIFSILINNTEKTFSYSDYITGNIKLKLKSSKN